MKQINTQTFNMGTISILITQNHDLTISQITMNIVHTFIFFTIFQPQYLFQVCYFFVFGQAFPAIQRMAPSAVAVSPDIEAYLDFVVTMFIAFGVAFEVPIVVVILARMGVVTIEQLKAFRTYFVVAAAAVSGLVTPPDPVSMVALLVPMVILYEAGIWSAQLFMRYSQSPDADASDPSA